MLSEYAIQNITRTLKASQEYSSEDDLGEFLKLLDGASWRRYPDETPEKGQRVLVSFESGKPMLVEYNPQTWWDLCESGIPVFIWLPVQEVEK